MKKLALLLALLFAALLFVSCDAPGVILLDSLMPPLMEKTTGYAVTTEIRITKLTTGETVSFTEPADLNNVHLQFEGIKCIRDKKFDDIQPLYNVAFFTATSGDSFDVCTSTDFIYGEYHYDAMRSGVDFLWLEGLFN
ncbi:MAG: hypothetical protein IK132_13955 [Clostridia bacterium]|jgi:hypothetical protein|nr:hypothetical protein [Clostridia bacterium]